MINKIVEEMSKKYPKANAESLKDYVTGVYKVIENELGISDEEKARYNSKLIDDLEACSLDYTCLEWGLKDAKLIRTEDDLHNTKGLTILGLTEWAYERRPTAEKPDDVICLGYDK